ncbi:LytR/AlgR family response regulator transcription factor [Paraglaciecola arctica]|uniref:Two-component system, response regulator YesN n=1 Tax=Paraglaciecola arctica BSs20135 TaxID=493475 RepID=K6XC99_9ALTE|nr:response regulator [Paraglaciecola arctica]GAC18264.1 two-component system, response regulator YesN [Paraglaciecola arctica BSs20135]
MFTTLIVDDEPLAHEVIKHHLQAQTDFKIVGNCYNATQALSYLANDSVDLLVLDINMPALSGIELLKVLNKTPQVIIISAYQEYAIEGFELDVADYLLKPVSASRLAQALDKVRRRLEPPPPSNANHPNYIVLKVGREKRKFVVDEISLLEAYGNYVRVWQGEQAILVSSTLKQCLQQLPQTQFVQVHKSFVVNKQQVVARDNQHIRLTGDRQIKVGKSFKDRLLGLL